MKRWLWGLSTLLLATVTFNSLSPVLEKGAANAQTGEVQISSIKTLDKLRELAPKQYLAPIDAKINTAGRKNVIPELNGIEVNVDATWNQIQGQHHDSRVPFVYRQVPPKITMKDLGPLPIYQGNPAKKQIALMVNVAWGTEYLGDILLTLEQNRAKATFFLDGSWLSKNEEMAKKIVAAGHEIGNHAYTHPNMAALSADKQIDQISRTQTEIRNRLGIDSKWFAPPSGSYNDTTVRTAHNLKLGTVLWTLDTVDWKRPPIDSIIQRILPNAKNGAMVLMHPTEPTAKALRTLVPELQAKGFQLVTVSELLSPIRTP